MPATPAAVSLSDWHDFFSAVAGCAATLTGLITVGVSLGIKTILEYPQLPNKALGAIVVLVTVLLVAMCGLAPGQPLPVVGGEVLAVGLLGWGITTWLAWQGLRHIPAEYRRPQRLTFAVAQLATLPYLGAGAALLAGHGAGLYAVLLAIACSFCKATVDAWILLVEIHR